MFTISYIDSIVEDCGNSFVNAQELLQSCDRYAIDILPWGSSLN